MAQSPKKPSPARRVAVRLVQGVLIDQALLMDMLQADFVTDLAPHDRAAAQRLATQTLRQMDRARAVLRPFLRKPPDLLLMALLCLGVVERAVYDAPAHRHYQRSGHHRRGPPQNPSRQGHGQRRPTPRLGRGFSANGTSAPPRCCPNGCANRCWPHGAIRLCKGLNTPMCAAPPPILALAHRPICPRWTAPHCPTGPFV